MDGLFGETPTPESSDNNDVDDLSGDEPTPPSSDNNDVDDLFGDKPMDDVFDEKPAEEPMEEPIVEKPVDEPIVEKPVEELMEEPIVEKPVEDLMEEIIAENPVGSGNKALVEAFNNHPAPSDATKRKAPEEQHPEAPEGKKWRTKAPSSGVRKPNNSFILFKNHHQADIRRDNPTAHFTQIGKHPPVLLLYFSQC